MDVGTTELSRPSAHPMTELADLRDRAKAAGARPREAAEEDRKRNERLSNLLSAVEEGLAYSQHKIQSLSEELACANEEKQQLQAILQTLLAEAEDDSAHALGAARRKLEARIDRLVEAASSIKGTLGDGASKSTKGSPAKVSSDEEDRTAAGPETDTELAIRPSEEVLKKALAAAEKVKGRLGREAKQKAKSDLTIAELSDLYIAQGCTAEKPTTLVTDEARTPRSDLVHRVQAGTDAGETSTMSPVSGEEATHEREPPGTVGGEEKEPLELTQMVAEDGAMADLNDDQGHPAEKGRATVQQIIKRVSLMTGALREGQEQVSTSPDPDAAPEEDKKVENQSLLDIPDFLDRRDAATYTPASQRASVRRRS